MGVKSRPAPVGTPSNPTWLSLFRFTAKRHLPVLFLGVFLAVAASLTTPAMAVLLGNIFNTFTLFGAGSISGQSLVEKVTSGCVGLACLGAVSWTLNASYFTLFIIFGELQASSSRGKLFEELLKRNLEWFETQHDGTGAFLSSLQAQMGELRTATSQPLGLVLQFSFRSVGSLGLGLYTSWNLTLVTLAGIPVFSSMIAVLSTRMKRNIHAQETELNHVSKIANSATTSIDTVKCLNGQEFEYRNFVSRVDNAAVHYLKQARFNSLQITIIRVMMFAMFVQGFWYGSSLAISGKLSAGDVLRTFWACLTAAQSIELVLPQVIVLEKGKIAATALDNVISDQSGSKTVNEMKGTLYPRHCEGDIEVNDMSFCYSSQPDALILRSANFFFPAGETTFVIGKSGSGKSTLGQLLTRFYLPESGEILIDGNPIQDLSVNWIRNNVTLIEQRSVLFDESVFTNIAFGRRDYDRVKKKDVQKCIELAMLQTVIDTLPNGIDTCVGSGGNLLSGGQRQRVAIGRARLRDTPILIMDEPTSALDGTNRAAVMKAIREWRKGKTTIVITHDMSQILPRDFVYILEQGAIMESGYRHELENNPMNEKDFHLGDKAASLDETQSIDDCAATYKASIPEVYLDTSSVSSVESLPDIEPGQPYFQSTRANARSLSSYRNTRPLSSRHSYVERDPFARFSGIPLHDLNSVQTQNTNAAAVPFQPRPMSTAQPSQPLEVPSRRASVKQYRRRRRKSDKKKSKGPSLRQILWTIVPNISAAQRVFLTIGFVCSLAHATSIPVFSYCLAQVFGSFYATTDNSHTAMRWSLAVLGVAIADGIVSFFMHYCLEISGQAWVDCLRKKGFSRVLDQPRVWFEKESNRPYKLTACFDQNGEDMKNLVGRFAGFVLVAVAILIMAIVWSLVVCWKLALVVLACGPVIFAITRGFERTSGVWENRCSEASRIISGIFVETFSEIRTVRTLTLESFFHRKHMKAASKCTTVGFKKAGYTGVLFGLVESTVIFVCALIFYYGSILVSSREFTVSDVVTVFSMLLFSVGYASSLMSFIPQISTSQERASQLLRLADLPEGASHEHLGSMRMIKTAPVKFNKVDFRYPSRPDALILKDVSITIPRGCCTAIVGRSGSGKSTIASLLLSLYEAPLPHIGDPSISLGGIDIRRLHTPTLRSMVSIVSQQPTVFPGTIHANIAYGLDETSPLCSAHSVTNAARAAGIDDFISSLPRGYATLVREGGVGLSGGQAQRIVIARALVRRPQILILDEATSALDPSSAELIKQTVQELVAVRRHELTVIIITHAKEMMEIADNIVVLEQGSVVEEGPFKILAGRGGGKLRMLLEGGDDEED